MILPFVPPWSCSTGSDVGDLDRLEAETWKWVVRVGVRRFGRELGWYEGG